MKAAVWTLAFGQREDRWPTHDYEPTREAAMAGEYALDAQDPEFPSLQHVR